MTPTDRLATHLADVKNADKAHRLIRTEDQQKLEALTRLVCELADKVEELEADARNDRTGKLEMLERE